MAADSFIRRASGLLVPRMSFAAPWKFLPCEDCCESGFKCINCDPDYYGEFDVTFAGVVNDNCSNCADWNTTFRVTLPADSCVWAYRFPVQSCTGSFNEVWVTVGTSPAEVYAIIADGKCLAQFLPTDVSAEGACTSVDTTKGLDAVFGSFCSPPFHCDYSSATARIVSVP